MLSTCNRMELYVVALSRNRVRLPGWLSTHILLGLPCCQAATAAGEAVSSQASVEVAGCLCAWVLARCMFSGSVLYFAD